MPDPDDDAVIARVPGLIRAGRDDFARLYDAEALARDGADFVPLHVLVQMERLLGGGGAETGSDRFAFELGFRHAAEKGWTRALFAKVVMAGFVPTPGDTASAAETRIYADIGRLGAPAGAGIEIDLQAMVNPADGYLDPLVFAREMQLATRRICQVVVDRQRRGTGFLVGPQVVLTNWHVVRDLYPGAGAGDTGNGALAALGGRLKVVFDRFRAPAPGGAGGNGGVGGAGGTGLGGPGAAGGSRAATYPARAIDLSNAAYPSEYLGEAIDIDQAPPWAGNDEKLDFALIRLDGVPGVERGWYRLLPDLWPRTDASVYVAQYPGQYALKIAAGRYVELCDAHRRRVRHGANTARGASGGLCLGFDRQTGTLKPSALHQASVTVTGAAGVAAGAAVATGAGANGGDGATVNQAIPLAKIAPLIAPLARRVDDAAPLLRLGAASGCDHVAAPVLGRAGFQKYVAEAVNGDARIIVVRPSVSRGRSTRGLGKSFSEVLLRSLVATDTHVVVSFRADEIPTDAGETARAILDRIAPAPASTAPATAAPAGPAANPAAPGPAGGAGWSRPEGASTTETAWIADHLIDLDFAPRLAAAAHGRLVWLVLDELDRTDLPDAGGRRFLDALYQKIATVPALRIVLIGLSRDLPSFDPALLRVDLLERPPGESEVIAWLNRRFGAGRAVDGDIVAALARLVTGMAGAAEVGTGAGTDPGTGAGTGALARAIRDRVDPVLPPERGVDDDLDGDGEG